MNGFYFKLFMKNFRVIVPSAAQDRSRFFFNAQVNNGWEIAKFII